MSYKAILVYVDQSKRSAERIKIAARIASAKGAHLIGTAMTGISRFVYGGEVINPQDPGLVTHLNLLRERANRALDQFEALAKEMGVLSFERRLVNDEAGAGMCLQARYCDLVVIGQTDVDDPLANVMPDFPEYVLMNCGRPLLIVPSTGHFSNIGTNVLIAWSASMEATRAVTAALPILKLAKIVKVVVLNPAAEPDAHGAEPGADIALYLARHNVNVDVMQKTTETDAGNALLSVAQDLSSDLIVMGAYGHSRFREILLGGATRTILESMTVPVLMTH